MKLTTSNKTANISLLGECLYCKLCKEELVNDGLDSSRKLVTDLELYITIQCSAH